MGTVLQGIISRGISSMEINADGCLIFTMSDGEIINVGYVVDERVVEIPTPSKEMHATDYTAESIVAIRAACDKILAAESNGKKAYLFHAAATGGYYPMGYTKSSGIWYFAGINAKNLSDAVNGDSPLYVTRLIYDYSNDKITEYTNTGNIADYGDWLENWGDFEDADMIASLNSVYLACNSVLIDAKAYVDEKLLINTEAEL